MNSEISKGKRIARVLFGSSISSVGWAGMLSALFIGIAYGAANSSRMSRDTNELFQLVTIVLFLLGISLVIMGIFHRWLESK